MGGKGVSFLDFEKNYLKNSEVTGYQVISIACNIYADKFWTVFLYHAASVLYSLFDDSKLFSVFFSHLYLKWIHSYSPTQHQVLSTVSILVAKSFILIRTLIFKC